MIRGVAYLAGPYRAKNGRTVIENIRAAEKIAIKWWKCGFAVICPHLNTAFFDGLAPDELWLQGDLNILTRCDLILVMSNYKDSAGSLIEVEAAKGSWMKVVYLDGDGNEIIGGRYGNG